MCPDWDGEITADVEVKALTAIIHKSLRLYLHHNEEVTHAAKERRKGLLDKGLEQDLGKRLGNHLTQQHLAKRSSASLWSGLKELIQKQ